MFFRNFQEVYSRDEGNSPDDHDNDLFEKVTRQICNRINELEDDMKRSGSLTDTRRGGGGGGDACLLYTSPSPRDKRQSRMPSSA